MKALRLIITAALLVSYFEIRDKFEYYSYDRSSLLLCPIDRITQIVNILIISIDRERYWILRLSIETTRAC